MPTYRAISELTCKGKSWKRCCGVISVSVAELATTELVERRKLGIYNFEIM